MAEGIAQQLERRVSTWRAMKRGGAVGDAARCAGSASIRGGRLGGRRDRPVGLVSRRCRCTRCARTSITPHSARDRIRSSWRKVWIYKGDILAHDPLAVDKRAMEQQTAR